jgi:DNA-binding NarL/FixJ family response regulator
VLVVDDHAVFAEAVQSLLTREPDLRPVWVAHTLAEARTLLRQHQPTVAVLDLMLGDGSGLDLAEYAREHSPASRVLMLTAVTSTERVVAALRLGVRGWLPKTVDSDRLVQVIRGLARGEAQLAPELLGAVLPELIRQPEAPADDPLASLTAREREILQCLVDGLTRAQIASRLYLSTNTVRTHLQNLLTKLGVHSALESVAVGLRYGMVPLPVPPAVRRQPASDVPLQRPGQNRIPSRTPPPDEDLPQMS